MRNLNKALVAAGVTRESLPSYREARARWAAFRDAEGVPGGPVALLTAPDGNAKYAKTQVPVYGLSLAPDKSSGYAVCDYSTAECRKGCVAFAGKGPMPVVIRGRRLKTRLLAADPSAFLAILTHEITSAKARHDGKVGVRLNGFSDLCWESIAPWLFEEHADVAFYDYTKRPFGSRDVPSNYHLTYSVSEHEVPTLRTVRSTRDVPRPTKLPVQQRDPSRDAVVVVRPVRDARCPDIRE
jgi:hypothetical protein